MIPVVFVKSIGLAKPRFRNSENSRRLWRSQRRKSRSVPEGGADFPAAIFLAGKCSNLGRDSASCCQKIGEEFSSSVEICRKAFPARNLGQPTAFSSFLRNARNQEFGHCTRQSVLEMPDKGFPKTSVATPAEMRLVNLFFIKFVRILGFSFLFSAIAVFLALSGQMCSKYCDR